MFRSVFFAALAGTQLVTLAGAEPPGLSGKWNGDLQKCDFGMESVPSSLVYNIAQKGLSLRVERVRGEGGKETKAAQTLDGRWDGTAPHHRIPHDLSSLRTGGVRAMELAPDKKTLTVVRSISSGGGNVDQKLVFQKESSQ